MKKLSRRYFVRNGLLLPAAGVFFIPRIAKAQASPVNALSPFFARGAASAGSFTYTSVVFDGTNDYLSRGAQLTGVADSKVGLFSCWYKGDSSSSGTRGILSIVGDYFNVNHASDTAFSVTGYTSAAANILQILGTNAISLNAWHHLLCSWDLQAGVGKYYIDGTDDTRAGATLTDGSVDYTRNNCYVGSRSAGSNKTFGLLSEVYFTTEYLDITQSSNRLKFRTAGGKPEDLGSTGATPTGTQPIIYLHNDFNSFGTNSGSGGNFTVNGSLGDGGADIP